MKARIRADRLLVERGLVASRARAQAEIAAGTVTADGERVRDAAQKLSPCVRLEIAKPENPYVSRGGLKLAHALERFAISVAGARALDVGAATGGFTQVLLARGAAHVVAVDVGHGQLHESLRADPRVTQLEGRDVRGLTVEEVGTFNVACIDVSFISLRLVVPVVERFVRPDGHLVLLVKPQFEVGPGAVGKGGLVRDPAMRERAVADITNMVSALDTWRVLGVCQSPVAGGDGNIEFLLAARRDGESERT